MLSDLEQGVLDKIDEKQVVDWTRQLVQIPSVYRPQKGEAEEAAAAQVKEWFEQLGLETHWQVVEPGRPNVIGILPGPEGKRLMFEGHTDVVTEGDPDKWTHPPFSAHIEDGKIYGRGANDMKGGLVAAILATKAIIDAGVKLNGSILIGALVDEEGGMIGVKHFVDQGWMKGVDAVVVCEPEDNRICIAQKGVMWVRVLLDGKMAHGAMPLTGINPMYMAGELLVELRKLEAAEIAQYGKHEFLGQSSITPTIVLYPITGEPQNNVMPGQALMTLDIRLVPGQSPEETVQKIEAIFARLHARDQTFKASLEVIESRAPTATDRNEPIVVELARAFRQITGREEVYGGVPGSTDGTIIFERTGVPVITVGPGDTLIPHHYDEFLDIDQLIVATKMYALAAMRYLGVQDE